MFNNLLELKKEIDISKIEQIQEIKLNEKLKEELSKLFSEEEKGFVKINDCTSIIKTDKNYVFFSNQYFYLAVICKNYAEALYSYCNFFDEKIRNSNELSQIVLKQDFTNKRYIELFEDKNDKELFTKFLRGEDFRPGKKFINGNEEKSFRGTKDLFGSCILKMLPLPDASSGYFGSIVYYLSKRKDLFDELENFYREDKKEQYSISYFYNRIIFGAPGTGKSFRLENQRKEFFDEGIAPTQEQIIASEIQEAGNNHGSCFAIGLKYSEFFSGKKPKNLKAEYNCSNEDAYTICQGMRAKDFYASLPDYKTEEISEQKIKYQLEKLKNEKYMNQAGCAAIGLKYSDFLQDNSISDISNMFDLSRTSSLAAWIYYGMQAADYTFDETSAQKSLKHYERVTFHPNYSYSQFVGCYKPKMKSVQTDEGEKEEITYSFVPGPFLRVYVNAVKNPVENFLLLIEEINRANVAAVFGDVFQLLDRKDGKSEYPVAAGEDIRKYLKTEGINQSELSIPKNMFIWATMNSADQGVFPMDTAFKRRWNFEYIGIDENENGVSAYEIPISRIVDKKKIIKKVNWNKLRQAINKKLISLNVNEDKLLGPYFISEKDLKSAMQNQEDFIKLFKSKVLMYLFEDAAKMKRNFFNCEKYIYSEICNEFDEKGIEVFNFSDDEKGKLVELDIASNPENSEPASK